IANPENPNRAMLVVTGQSPEAVKKAAQALSDPTLRLGQSGTLMIVTDVHPSTTAAAVNIVTNRATFADLGYGTQDLQVNGLGTSFLDVQFKLPQGYQADAGSFVELYFNAADTLADSTSVVSVFMNDTPLQSIALSTTTAAQTAVSVDSAGRHVLHAVIPASSLIPGELNDLSIQVDIEGQWHCAPPNDSSLWFAVSPDSFISVPRSAKTQVATTRTVGQFPASFTQSPDLHDVWFVLPTQPTALDFQQLIDLTQKLGVSTLSGATFNPHVSFGELPKDADTASYNFIVLGLPSTNPFLNGLNKSLPQPFIPGSDTIQQIIDNVVYQLPAQFNLGILQTLPSDWNPDHTVLVITGITPQGQKEAGQILTAGIVPRSQLTGNVVFSRSTGIISVDTGAQQRRLDANLTAQSPLSTQEATEPPATLQALTPSPESSPEPSATIYQIQAAEVDGLPTATLVEATPTAIPTYTPLPTELLEPAKVEQPQWVNGLIIVTGGIILLTLLYGLIRLIRSRRSVI
ncbi:MAG: cellulose biosynthesis cyclic di-GMP-binding regulatory protein BcsB, partial [Chloroflexota bacterium]